MSLDSEDSPSPSFDRDWFFPSPSLIHQSPPEPPKSHRRFSTTPKHSPDSILSKSQSFRPTSSIPPPTTSKYGILRRRVEFPRPLFKPSKQEHHVSFLDRKPVVPREKKQSTEKVSSGPPGHRVRFRWNLTITAAVSVYTVPFLLVWFGKVIKKCFLRWLSCGLLQIVITALASSVHKNFTLHNQVIELQVSLSL